MSVVRRPSPLYFIPSGHGSGAHPRNEIRIIVTTAQAGSASRYELDSRFCGNDATRERAERGISPCLSLPRSTPRQSAILRFAQNDRARTTDNRRGSTDLYPTFSSNPISSAAAFVADKISSKRLLFETVMGPNSSFCRSRMARTLTNSSRARKSAMSASRHK